MNSDVIFVIETELDESSKELLVVDELVADDPQVGHHLADVGLNQNSLLVALTSRRILKVNWINTVLGYWQGFEPML